MRSFPGPGLEEIRAELPLAGMEGAYAQIARRKARLERVQDVVDFDEVLGCGLGDVGGGELDGFEARQGAVGEVEG